MCQCDEVTLQVLVRVSLSHKYFRVQSLKDICTALLLQNGHIPTCMSMTLFTTATNFFRPRNYAKGENKENIAPRLNHQHRVVNQSPPLSSSVKRAVSPLANSEETIEEEAQVGLETDDDPCTQPETDVEEPHTPLPPPRVAHPPPSSVLLELHSNLTNGVNHHPRKTYSSPPPTQAANLPGVNKKKSTGKENTPVPLATLQASSKHQKAQKRRSTGLRKPSIPMTGSFPVNQRQTPQGPRPRVSENDNMKETLATHGIHNLSQNQFTSEVSNTCTVVVFSLSQKEISC